MIIVRVGRVIHLDVKMFIPSNFLIKVRQNIKYYINNVKVNVILSMGRYGSVNSIYCSLNRTRLSNNKQSKLYIR